MTRRHALAMLMSIAVSLLGAPTRAVAAPPSDSAPPSTTAPFDLDTLITDRAEVLDGPDRTRLVRAINELRDEHGIQLYVALVDSFGGVDPTQWANDTAVANGLDRVDVLFGIAVEDGRYGWSVDQQFALSDDDLVAIVAATEPLLADGRWADAGIAAADGLRQALAGSDSSTTATEPPPALRHEFEMTLVPDGWTTVITIEALSGRRPGDLPRSFVELDGCSAHLERDLVVPITVTQTNPTGFSDSPQYLLQIIGDVDGIVEVSTADECFDLVNAAMSATFDLDPGTTERSLAIIVLREYFTPAHPDGDPGGWADAVLQFLPGDDWISEHGGDVENPVYDVQLNDTTLDAVVESANEVPLSVVLPDTDQG